MKKVFLFFSAAAILISGCSFDVHWVTPQPVEATLPPVVPTPIVFSPTESLPTPTDTPIAGFTPESGASLFYGAYTVLDTNDASGRSIFPAGTNRIYAIWKYQNMRAGMLVKREWYLDGELWLVREEEWNFSKYGAFGTVQDVSIYDEQIGLPSGMYQLKMYIDGLLQPIGAPTADGAELWLNFKVQPNESVTEVASPDFKWSALVSNGSRLIVRDVSGKPTEMFAGLEIPDFVWFPDSQHILFIDRDRTGQNSGTNRGIHDKLWIVDIVREEIIPLYDGNSPLGFVGGMTISPDGRFIAITEGSGDGDACFVSLNWLFLEIGSSFDSVRVLRQDRFDGLPVNPDSSVYPTSTGVWQSSTQFMSPMKVTCVTDNLLAGEYVFDVANMKAVKR
jgi:hypothetical protein